MSDYANSAKQLQKSVARSGSRRQHQKPLLEGLADGAIMNLDLQTNTSASRKNAKLSTHAQRGIASRSHSNFLEQNGSKQLDNSSSKDSLSVKKSWANFFERNKVEKGMMKHLTDAMQRPESLQFMCKRCSSVLFTSEQIVSHGLRSVKAV